MGDLSEHFSTSEFADPSTGECHINPFLISALEELRAKVGKPIIVHSGYRSPRHNAEVGGASHSQHLLGKAADISVKDFSVLALYAYATQVTLFDLGGVGIYPEDGFIHVDVRPQRARWARLGGEYVSFEAGLERLATQEA